MINYIFIPEVSGSLDAVFGALADPTRRAILARLAEGPASVGELARPLPMSPPAVSKHLKVLERAGLLIRVRDGRVHCCHLSSDAMAGAGKWILHTCTLREGHFDNLARYPENTI